LSFFSVYHFACFCLFFLLLSFFPILLQNLFFPGEINQRFYLFVGVYDIIGNLHFLVSPGTHKPRVLLKKKLREEAKFSFGGIFACSSFRIYLVVQRCHSTSVDYKREGISNLRSH